MRARGLWLAASFLIGLVGAGATLLAVHLWDDHAALHILAQREGQRIAAEGKR